MIDVLLVAEALPENRPGSFAVGVGVTALLAASCAVWAWIVAKWRLGKPAIPRTARVDVPWFAPEVLVVIGLVLLLTIASSLVVPEAEPPAAANDFAQSMLGNAAFYAGLAAMVVVMLVFARRANSRDLGLPLKLPGDLVYGGLGWLAALAPVYGLQIALVRLVEADRQPHPLIEMLIRDRRLDLLGLAILSAVVIAPAVEEFLFRVLLQGWLEKCFTPSGVARIANELPLGHRLDETDVLHAEVIPVDAMQPTTCETPPPAASPPLATFAASDVTNRFASPHSDLGEPTSAVPSDEPEFGVVRRAAPIVISSVAFAAAHAGTWPDPLPLFVLALVLGYVYRQTHRLWPSVLLHMLFNGLSLAMVWFGAE